MGAKQYLAEADSGARRYLREVGKEIGQGEPKTAFDRKEHGFDEPTNAYPPVRF